MGSVRALVDDAAAIVSSHSYSPIGVPDSDYGAGFWFTGEQTDENDNIYLRARYMNPNLGTFLSLDPFEGVQNRPMSLNGYSWVEGNVPNLVDASGMNPSDCACFCAENGSGPYSSDCFVRCVLDGGITRNERRFFYYNRQIAARTAISLAAERTIGDNSDTSRHILGSIQFEDAPGTGDTDSARFISLVLRAGGYPMTTTLGANEECASSSNVGWCAKPSNLQGQFVGNETWRNHVDDNISDDQFIATELRDSRRLATYLLGNTGEGVQLTGGYVTPVSVSQVIGLRSDGNPYYANDVLLDSVLEGRKYAEMGNNLANVINTIQAFEAGDYVVTVKPSGFNTSGHGFIVTGWGAATKCYGDDRSPIADVQVPYVVDLGGTQSGNERPFYCSRIPAIQDQAATQFGHYWWYFVKVPSSGTIERHRVLQDQLPELSF